MSVVCPLPEGCEALVLSIESKAVVVAGFCTKGQQSDRLRGTWPDIDTRQNDSQPERAALRRPEIDTIIRQAAQLAVTSTRCQAALR